MSKILKALEKAQEHKAEVEQKEVVKSSITRKTFNWKLVLGFLYPASLVIMLLITVSTVQANHKTFAAFSKSENNTAILVEKLDEQSKSIKTLETIVKRFEGRESATVRKLRNQVRELDTKLKNRENDISDMAIDYNILRVIVNDLTVTNQALMEQYIALNTKIEELQKHKRELLSLQEYK